MARFNTETVWEFETARFRVVLEIEPENCYQYDGDDKGGKIQAKIDDGEYVAFQSAVRVFLDGIEVGADYLGGSVYDARKVSEFWTAHRTSKPRYRNTLKNKARNTCIGRYFPGMVSEAIGEARKQIAKLGAVKVRA